MWRNKKYFFPDSFGYFVLELYNVHKHYLQCIPPAYLSLHCLGGECGTILQGDAGKCPQPCSVHKKCGDCRKSPGCGWCAFGGLNGLGVCMSGTRSGPHGKCELNNVSYEDRSLAGKTFINTSYLPVCDYCSLPLGDCLYNMQLLGNTLQPFYNTVRYNKVLDVTQFKNSSQKM